MAPELKAVRASGSGKSGLGATLKSFYNDPFRWTFIKSWAMFATGVWIAREMTGLDLMAPPTPA